MPGRGVRAWLHQEAMHQTSSGLGKPSEPQRALTPGLLGGGDAASGAQTLPWC